MVKRRDNLKIKLTEKRNDCNGRIGEVLVSFKASECIFDQKQKLKSKIQEKIQIRKLWANNMSINLKGINRWFTTWGNVHSHGHRKVSYSFI